MQKVKAQSYLINSDLLFFKAIKCTVSPQDLENWTLLFEPDSFKGNSLISSIENYTMG